MRVLLVAPESGIPADVLKIAPSSIIDLARAPVSTYQEWSRAAQCPVFSLYDLAEGTDDLHGTRELVELGMDHVVDRSGIDWWDVLVQAVVPQLQQLMLVCRLGGQLPNVKEIFSTRNHPLAKALGESCHARVVGTQSRSRFPVERAKRSLHTFAHLDLAQMAQVLQDKFDPQHTIRRRLVRHSARIDGPVVLLPSAYVNVSRTALAYAAMLPETNFLLVFGRKNGQPASLPQNVRAASLDPFFSDPDDWEVSDLQQKCERLRRHLVGAASEFALANSIGLLDTVFNRLGWGIRIRDAWEAVFRRVDVCGCLSADDSNPYSRLPLMLARRHGVTALACHHGALDSRMAIKRSHADHYLAKSEMERDYLLGICRRNEHIVVGAPVSNGRAVPQLTSANMKPSWLVFFSEPLDGAGWRKKEIYKDLLPKLLGVARECGLQLVFKLHPFESVRGHRWLLRRFFSRAEIRGIRILAGPISSELWQRTHCAVTVQSTVALDCAEHRIPVFMCGWLADAQAGYAQQYLLWGIGKMLQSPEELTQLPQLLSEETAQRVPRKIWKTISPKTFEELLSGTWSPAMAVNA